MQLVQIRPDLAKFVSLGDEVVIAVDDKIAVQIGAEGKTELSDEDVKLLKLSSPTNVSRSEMNSFGSNLFAGAFVVLAGAAPVFIRLLTISPS